MRQQAATKQEKVADEYQAGTANTPLHRGRWYMAVVAQTHDSSQQRINGITTRRIILLENLLHQLAQIDVK